MLKLRGRRAANMFALDQLEMPTITIPRKSCDGVMPSIGGVHKFSVRMNSNFRSAEKLLLALSFADTVSTVSTGVIVPAFAS